MKQPSLFDDLDAGVAMPVTTPAIPGSSRTLSAIQHRFNALLDQIGTLRHEHQRWQVFMDTYSRRMAGELAPEVALLRTAQIALARLLDGHVAQSRLSKRDRATLQELLIDLLEELLREEEIPELRTLYELHTGTDQAEEAALDFELLRAMASALPVDVDAYCGDPNPEAFSEWIDRQLGARAEPARGRKRRARTHEIPPPPPDDATTALRKVFRRLASALHPDRESDPHEQRRKTALMQDLNAAYAAGDLLRILELQHAIDVRGPDALATLSDLELGPYIQLLQAQVKKLRQETDALLAPITAAFPGQTARSLTAARVDKALDQEITQVRRIRRNVDADLQRFADVAALKEALAQSRLEQAAVRQVRSSGRRSRRTRA